MGDSLSQMGPESNYHAQELRDALELAGVPEGMDAVERELELAGFVWSPATARRVAMLVELERSGAGDRLERELDV